MLYLVQKIGCEAYGVDLGYGDDLEPDPHALVESDRPMINLKRFYIDPSIILGDKIHLSKGDVSEMDFADDSFDRIFCISAIEHMEEGVAKKAIAEMVRVLKPGGKLVMTMDYTRIKSTQFEDWAERAFASVIEWSGLPLDGESDFTVPGAEERHGLYDVVGFCLKKE